MSCREDSPSRDAGEAMASPVYNSRSVESTNLVENLMAKGRVSLSSGICLGIPSPSKEGFPKNPCQCKNIVAAVKEFTVYLRRQDLCR